MSVKMWYLILKWKSLNQHFFCYLGWINKCVNPPFECWDHYGVTVFGRRTTDLNLLNDVLSWLMWIWPTFGEIQGVFLRWVKFFIWIAIFSKPIRINFLKKKFSEQGQKVFSKNISSKTFFSTWNRHENCPPTFF